MIEINVAVSNRHVHLTREDIDELFGEGYKLTVRNMLSQKSDFAANEVVPLPTKGSNTVSPTKENILINRFGNSSGHTAGLLPR